MRDYITLGTAPVDEDCAQVGQDGYREQVREESERFINQLRRTFGNEPEGARFALKSFPHDFGTYHEVVIYYDDEKPETIDYAYNIENNLPEKWD